MALATELLGPADLDVQVLVPRRDISWLENGGGGLGGVEPQGKWWFKQKYGGSSRKNEGVTSQNHDLNQNIPKQMVVSAVRIILGS
jgi:hypothetical protein